MLRGANMNSYTETLRHRLNMIHSHLRRSCVESPVTPRLY